MYYRKLFFTVTFTLAGLCMRAQVDTTLLRVDSNSVIVHADPRLALLVQKQAEINKATTVDVKRTDKGYRLLIISTNSRNDAIAAKTKVYTYFPELKAYLWYQSPYFRVKAGNFKERKDAEDYQKKMNSLFPKGVFVMKDEIEVKPKKDTETPEDGN
jgi:hypothetical protein